MIRVSFFLACMLMGACATTLPLDSYRADVTLCRQVSDDKAEYCRCAAEVEQRYRAAGLPPASPDDYCYEDGGAP